MSETLHIYLNAEASMFHFEPGDFRNFQALLPEVELKFLHTEFELIEALPNLVWLDTWHFEAGWYERAPNLKAVFTPAAGNDWVDSDPGKKAVRTVYGTFHGEMMAETALGLVLDSSLNLTEYATQQQSKAWYRRPARLLRNQSILILGYGHVGRKCGALLSDLGMSVWGQTRSPHQSHDGKVRLVGLEDLDQILPKVDHVISFLPGAESTRHFVGKAILELMSNSAYFYNFGRGSTLDEAALLCALDNGEIAGAALDVTQIEPLPATSDLWHHPKIRLLPHASAYFEEYRALHVTELTNLMNRMLHTVV